MPLTELLATDTVPDIVLVTSGQRLARHILSAHARQQLQSGLQVWETPAVFTWCAWLERLWQQAVESGAVPELLLTSAQELALWERLIRERHQGESLLQPAAAARLARDAWELLQSWRLPLTDAELTSDEAQAFYDWMTRYQRECQEQVWLDQARLPDRLAELIQGRQLSLPRRLVFAEFDEFTPQQRQLLDALRAVGCEIETVNAPERKSLARRLALPTAADEITGAAQWVRHRLLANPQARIAVIVPDLAERRAAIARALDGQLIAGGLAGAGRDRTPVQFLSRLAAGGLSVGAIGDRDIGAGSARPDRRSVRRRECQHAVAVSLYRRCRQRADGARVARFAHA